LGQQQIIPLPFFFVVVMLDKSLLPRSFGVFGVFVCGAL
jgi:hypothetical protein